MKAILRIPTNEPFAFIELETEVETSLDAVAQYNHAMGHFKPTTGGVGLDPKEWNKALDGYLTVGNCPSDVYERMNDEQKRVMQEIKKAFKRINPPEKRE